MLERNPHKCSKCGALIYSSIKPVKCPKCGKPWIGTLVPWEKNPIHKVKGGWQWGNQKVYPTRAGAERQARAIYAGGYGGRNPMLVTKPRKQTSEELYESVMRKIGTGYKIKLGGYISKKQAIEYERKSVLFKDVTQKDRDDAWEEGFIY